MREIVDRLKDKRQIEIAKKLLESKGYEVKRLNESDAPKDDKFKVGDEVEFSMLYGGSVTAEVVARTEDTLTLREKWTAEEEGEEASDDTKYEVETDEEGVEYIIVWEYRDHKGYVYPPNSRYSEY